MEDLAPFSFENQQYTVPLEVAREVCYMNDGLIELPDGRLVCVTLCATPLNPGYIIDEVKLYTSSAQQNWVNSSQRIRASRS